MTMSSVALEDDKGRVTTSTEFESTTERSVYVLSAVHKTASSLGWPLIIRL